MTRSGWILFAGVSLLPGSASPAGDSRAEARRAEVPIRPLHASTTIPILQGGYMAWAGPTVCDSNGDVFFLLVPDSTPSDTTRVAAAYNPTDVLRISADGKERVAFRPRTASKFAKAKDLATHGIALDRDGRLSMLVSASWEEKAGEKTGQYILAFDKKGRAVSEQEVDTSSISADQFEVLGSGDFVLRGRRTDTDEARLMVLSSGGILRDVLDHPAKMLKEVSPSGASGFEFMARGGDGRVYITEQGADQEPAVYAVDSFGESREAFRLVPMPNNRQLLSWSAAGDRIAATYLEHAASSGAASGGNGSSRWWIAVYGNLATKPELQAVYGPAPGPPVCFQYDGANDRFTILKGGKSFVSMVP